MKSFILKSNLFYQIWRIGILCSMVIMFYVPAVTGNISLPAIFSDHMVLQQRSEILLWGWGKPNEELVITCSWETDRTYKLTVGNQSYWSIGIETPEAGGPYQLTFKGQNTILIDDVLIGEVWLGSGQSNMEWTPSMQIDHADEERRNANYPQIRFFTVLTSTADEPQQLLNGKWVVCTQETMWNFSAVLYFFGRDLFRDLRVPMGLINSSWGGTPLEVWVPEERIRQDRILKANASILKPIPWGPHEPGKAYNAMIHPVIPYRIKGALWYQGESNTANPMHYARALSTLIDCWRDLWGYQFPFYYVQIAPWKGYGDDNVNGAIIRDQQRKVLNITRKTGMVVTSDIGDLNDIHPGNKQDVGKRLAGWALSHDYGKEEISFSGPLYRSYELGKNKILVYFDHSVDGLTAVGGMLKDFEILDSQGNWIDVKAVIRKNTIEVLHGPDVSPRGLRYAYHNDSESCLFNSAGLPASSFEVLFSE